MLTGKGDATKLLNQNSFSHEKIPYGQDMAKRMIPRVLTFFFGLTYMVLFLDVFVEHHIGLVPIISARLIPVLFSLLATGISLSAGLWFRKETLLLFVITMGLSVLVGLMGAYFHLRNNLDNISIGLLHIFPPKFAPLAFSGIGIMGLLATFGFLKPSLDNNDLVLDPVCGRHFQRSRSEAVLKVNSHTYYLCCPICVREFRKSRGLIR